MEADTIKVEPVDEHPLGKMQRDIEDLKKRMKEMEEWRTLWQDMLEDGNYRRESIK